MGKRLSVNFYTRTDTVQVSKDLLGKYLMTNFDNQITGGRIVETEAYRAPEDKACHAYNNRYTNRTKTMFEKGGIAYIYLCYGIHHLFNVVTGTKGMAHAVLIRAIEPTDNIPFMLKRRNLTSVNSRLTAGPGIMSKALGITTAQMGSSLCLPDSNIWLEERDPPITEKQIIASPRVGIDYAEECVEWPWRFRIKDNKWTSPAK